MHGIIRLGLSIVFIFMIGRHVHAMENIKVLIINEADPRTPARTEKMEKLGSMKGELMVMGTHYSGTLDVWKGDSGLYVINELPLEEYIKDVVAAEVSPDWDMEALKAQAVVSRTYAVYQQKGNGNSFYDIASSVLHQSYKGMKPDMRISYAVEATSGELLTFEEKPIEAFYHSTCGGKTENSGDVFGKSYPYLKSVESSCNLSPYTSWEKRIPIEEIEKALHIPGIKDISIKSLTSTKRVRQLTVKTGTGAIEINATDLRKSLGWSRLPSTNFAISRSGDEIVFKGSGYGHGVGLCQWCALKMAREGKDYREILSFFYPGTKLLSYEDL